MMSEDELLAHMTYKIVQQQTSIYGIKVSIKREFWHGRDDFETLPAVITGTLFRHVSKKDYTVSIDWHDGRETENQHATHARVPIPRPAPRPF